MPVSVSASSVTAAAFDLGASEEAKGSEITTESFYQNYQNQELKKEHVQSPLLQLHQNISHLEDLCARLSFMVQEVSSILIKK